MVKAIKLSDKLIDDATKTAAAFSRSAPQQIEHWAYIGKIAEENPDLPYRLIKAILIGIKELEAGDISQYEFG